MSASASAHPGRSGGGARLLRALLGCALVAAFASAGCSSLAGNSTGRAAVPPVYSGSGNVVTKQLPLSNFSQVEASGALKVGISRGDSFEVTVTADDNVVDLVSATQAGSTLRLDMRPGSYDRVNVRVDVVMPDLTGLKLAGASRATMSGFRPASIDVGLSGASQVAGRLDGGLVDLTIAEASAANLGGTAETIVVTGSGAGQANLGDLAAAGGRVSLKEASTAIVNVRNKLDADLRSASTLYYVGNPTLGAVNSTEGSSVRHR